MQKVIDVSYHNGTIDWERVKKAGYHAILRCGYGMDLKKQDDMEWTRNASECARLGIPFGAYLYSYAKSNTDAMSEADHAIRLCEPYRDRMAYPVFFDTEEPGTERVSKSNAVIFCSRLKAEGFATGIYASESWWDENLGGMSGYVSWVAKWSENPPAIPWQLWQYTERGSAPGVSGRVDMSESRYDVEDTAVPLPDCLAREVIAGKYGNGAARRAALGDSYDVVQAIVDHVLSGKWRGLEKIANDVIAGRYGNGADRRAALGSAYESVQKIVNEKLK